MLNKLKQIRFDLVAAAAALMTALPVAPASALDLAAFEENIADIAASDDLVGLALAVVHNGETVLLRTYGERSVDAGAPITPQTRFRIASLSKGFAGVAAAQLAIDGQLSLDAPIKNFVPAFRLKNAHDANRITLEHVLSHRVGLPPYAYDNLLEAGIPPDTILQRLADVDLICAIGDCYAYQNVTYNMAAAAISQTSGRPFTDIVAEEFFQPLGMTSASYGRNALQADENWARSHRRSAGRAWRTQDVREAYYAIPASGGVNASINDMALWLNAQMGNAPDVLPEETLALAHHPRVSTPAEIRRNRQMTRIEHADYALGWRVYDYAGDTVVNHSGSVEGYSAQIAFLPEHEYGIVLLTNSRSRTFWSIMPMFLDMVIESDQAL